MGAIKKRTDKARFESKIVEANGCWNWKAYKDKDGYGRFRLAGEMQRAHRIAYQLYVGDIPDGLFVLHHCDNPSCVNPSHLFLGTDTDNIHDCMAKGRRPDLSGENNSHAKLTEEQVRTIRARRSEGVHVIVLAEEFGVSHTSISNIANRRSWAKL